MNFTLDSGRCSEKARLSQMGMEGSSWGSWKLAEVFGGSLKASGGPLQVVLGVLWRRLGHSRILGSALDEQALWRGRWPPRLGFASGVGHTVLLRGGVLRGRHARAVQVGCATRSSCGGGLWKLLGT